MSFSEWSYLMQQAQRGDATRYRLLLDEITPWLHSYFSARLPASMVEDAVQDTLFAMHEKRQTYDPTRPFGRWVIAIASYKWIDRLRALRRVAMQPISDEISIEDHGAAVQSASTLEKLLGELKPSQAEVIRLVKLDGFSIEEAAEKTGQSVSLVKVNIHRGISRMMSAARREAHSEG